MKRSLASFHDHEKSRDSETGDVLRRLNSVESVIGQFIPAIDAKLTDLQELLRKNRKEHLTVEEVADLTGRSAYTIRRWIQEQRLSATRLSEGGPRGKLLIPRSEVDRLIAGGRGGKIPDSAAPHVSSSTLKR